MGLHLTPNEPDDWANGPDYEEQMDCPDCVEGVVNHEAMTLDGIFYPAIVNQKCETCDGTGFVDPPEDDWYD